jgi:type IV secretion system protein VirD4
MVQLINAVFTMIFQLFEWILTGIGELVVSQVSTRRNETTNADFLPAHKVLSKNEDGFVYGDMKMPMKDAFSHSLVIGNSGSGKTTCVLLPSILSITNASMVVHDPSGELSFLSSGAKLDQTFNALTMYYDDPSKSEKFNPLSRLKTKGDIKQLCKILIIATLGNGGGNEVFWNTAAESLIALFVRYAIFYTPKEEQNLHNVLGLLNQFAGTPKAIDALMVDTKDEELLTEYKSFVAYDAKLLMNILATAKTALSLFADERIAEITSGDSIDFDELRNTKTIIYIRSNINQMKYFSPLTSLFFEQLFASVMKNIPEPNALPILCMLDECSSLHLPILPIASANLRKYACGLQIVMQTESQIIDLFGVQAARSIIANCFVKCYLPGQPLETARQLEILLGKFEFQNDQGQTKMKSLMSMDEIRTMSESLLLIGNKPAIKLDLIPFYKQKELLRLAKLPPYEKHILETDNESTSEEDE